MAKCTIYEWKLHGEASGWIIGPLTWPPVLKNKINKSARFTPVSVEFLQRFGHFNQSVIHAGKYRSGGKFAVTVAFSGWQPG